MSSLKTWIIKRIVSQIDDEDQLKQESKNDPEIEIRLQEEKQELLNAVLELSISLREVLILFYYHGYSEKEIVNILKIPAGTVRSRLYRSKENLKHQLELERN